MGYARNIGRIGALAVALGVGVAVTSAPGIAYGQPSSDSSSVSGDSSSNSSTPSGVAASSEGSSDTDSSVSDSASSDSSDSVDGGSEGSESVADADADADADGGAEDADAGEGEGEEGSTGGAADQDTDPAVGDEDAAPVSGDEDGDEEIAPVVGDVDAEPVAGDEGVALVAEPAAVASAPDEALVIEEVGGDSAGGEAASESTVSSSNRGLAESGAAVGSDQSAPAFTEASAESDGQPGAPSSVESASVLTAVSAAAATPPAPVSTLQDVVSGVVRGTAQVVVDVLDWVLAASGNTADSTELPWALAVVAWVRREIDQAFLAPYEAAQQAAAQAVAAQSPNLLVNPGAELGDSSLSGNSSVTIPGWTLTGTPTVIPYGALRNLWPVGLSFPMPDMPSFMGYPKAHNGPPDGGEQMFGGGNVADSQMTQTVDLSAAAADIDTGTVTYDLSAWLGGYLFNFSSAKVEVDFLDANKTYLDAASVGPVGMLDRFFHTKLKERQTSGSIPVGTRYAQVDLVLDQVNILPLGTNIDYNSAFADNISFSISADLPAPPPPTPPASTVGELDHFFMVYMENKGYNDILDSDKAPFLHSLMNAYGLAENYYGLTHPSLPNYYPVIGGSDFGITYECETPCIPIQDGTLLTDNIDDKFGEHGWKGYAQSQGDDPLVNTDVYDQSQLPFMAFEEIAYNPGDQDYARDHQRPLSEMLGDLDSDTPPNYLWIGANESFNGEGPIDSIGDVLKFMWSQITPGHQYNIPALDEFLSEQVPIIMNSKVWTDPDKKSVLVVTFDEDNDNLSLGFGDEGNQVVTVVIPSSGALGMPGDNPGEMREGHFIATDRYDHYSLLRTIEESLGLSTLTNNDKFALPMNEFWI